MFRWKCSLDHDSFTAEPVQLPPITASMSAHFILRYIITNSLYSLNKCHHQEMWAHNLHF